MKNYFLILLCVYSGFSWSQSWSAFRHNSVSYYSVNMRDIHSLRIDSTSTSGDTSQYFPFKMLRKDIYGQYRVKGDHWAGNHISELPDGTTFFYNQHHQPVEIRTQAGLNESWRVYVYPDSSYIEANIDSVYSQQVLNQADSVKRISFRLLNKAGLIIHNNSDSCRMIDSIGLKLSKNSGMIQIIDFFKFPVSSLADLEDVYGSHYQYQLIGLSNPETGIHKLRLSDLYDNAPGDTIQWEYIYTHEQTGNNYWTKTLYNDRITGVQEDLNLQKITYTIRRESASFTSFDETMDYAVDTITADHYLNSSTPYLPEPLEPFGNNEFWVSDTTSASKFYSNEGEFFDEMVYKHAGYFYSYRYFSGHYLSELNTEVRKLHYFRHDNQRFGRPLANIETWGTDEPDASDEVIVLFPNPATDKIYYMGGKEQFTEARIYDLQGRLMSLELSSENSVTVSGLKPGIYLLMLRMSQKMLTTKFIKR